QALDLADLYEQYFLVITDAILLEIANALARNHKQLCTLVQEDCLCKLISSFWGYYVFKCKVLLRDSTFLGAMITPI
ncbi:MAG: hypothetical protein ACKO5Q_13145, partial [Microcystaceae cyanobacterium]